MIIRVVTELYLEMTLMAFMNIYSIQFKTMTQALVSGVSLVAMAGLCYYPALTMAVISNNAYRLDAVTTRARIGELYGETTV